MLFYSFLHTSLFANDTIIVHKDYRLDILSTKQIAVNKIASRITGNGLYRGFRLQVLSTRSREEALSFKTSLLQKFPSQSTYLLFQSPYF